MRMYSEFKALHRDEDHALFRRWVILHGISDPRDVAVMVALYIWIERNNRL